MTDVPAKWYPDPTGRHDHRYWDGTKWTHHVADLGVAATEPYDGPPTPPEPEPQAAEAEPTAVTPITAVDPTPTSTWQAAPVEAELQPTPVATTAPHGRDGSRALILVIAAAAIVAIIVVIVLLATGGSDDSGSAAGKALSAQLAGRLRSANGFSPDDAQCVSSYMVDHLGSSRLKGVDLTGEQVPAALLSDFTKALGDGVVKCKVSADNLSPSSLPANPQDSAATLGVFITFYETTLGLDATKAQCLANQMLTRLNDGKASFATASDQLPDALKACKIPADVLQRLAKS